MNGFYSFTWEFLQFLAKIEIFFKKSKVKKIAGTRNSERTFSCYNIATVAMRLLCVCYAVAMLLLCSCCAVVMQLLCCCYAVAMWLLCSCYAVSMLLLCGCYGVAMQLLCLLCDCCAVAMLLRCGCYAVAFFITFSYFFPFSPVLRKIKNILL